MKRNIMTSNADCKTCNGTGRREEHRMPPGEAMRIGGGPQGYMVSAICRCVRYSPDVPGPTTIGEFDG